MNTFEAFEKRLKGLGKALDSHSVDAISLAIMGELMAQHKHRIFDNGLKSDGSKIGEYSQEPEYFSKTEFIRTGAFKAQGKPKEGKQTGAKFKNGNQRKTMFIQGGYSEFRKIQGRQNEFVNLKFSGSEERSLKPMKFGNSVIYANTDAAEHEKIEAQQSRYKNVFELSASEKEFIKTEIEKNVVVTIKGK